MSVQINFGTVKAVLESAAEDAYNQGFEAGWKAAVAKVLSAVECPENAGEDIESRGVDLVVEGPHGGQLATEVKSRARRGAVEEALEHVLTNHPGLTQEQIEAAALEFEPTISAKSVYNKLRYYEKLGRKYRRQKGRWYRIVDLPSDLPTFRNGVLYMPDKEEAPV